MTRSFFQRLALVLAGVVGLLGTRPATANAQKALVYCPVNVDATGCNTIVNALTGPTFPLGVDRGYDGTGGTVDLETVDLFSYAVFVVPSLADGSASQPYAKLRDPEVVEHLKAALIGRIAMWSGTPDQGATNRAMKDALIQNLSAWAAGAYGTAKGPGLVTLLDASASAVSRYDWVRAIVPVPVTSDANLLIYNSVRALNPRATAMLTSGAGPIAYTNMATFGFQVPNGAAGVSLDAVGQTGTAVGGQVVLLTMEAGNSTGATVMTDRDDYAPGTTVVITGSGWEPGETVKLTLHVDPVRDNDTELTAVADGSGNIRNDQFAPADYDLGVRFVLTATGLSSGKRAQATFTDGGVRLRTNAGHTVTVATRIYPGTTNSCTAVPQPPLTVSGSLNVSSGAAGSAFALNNNQFGKLIIPITSNEGGTYTSISTTGSGGTVISNTLVGSTREVCIQSNNGSASNLTDLTINYSAPIVPNVAPSFSKGADQTVNEDAPAQSVSWATAISAGPPSESGQNVDFIVSNDNNGLFAVQPAISPAGTLTYTTALNAHGSAIVTVQIHDDGGTANGGDDTSDPQTFTITVNSVNDAPTFVKGADQTVLEDAAEQTVNGWAGSISVGPSNESAQTVSFNVSNTNNELFSVQPSIAPNGTLTYTPAANAFGSATVTVTATDNGGTANGGIDTSGPQTFAITITGVNDEPSFTKGADQLVGEDAAPQSVANWATAISAGPNEIQTLTFTVGNDNPSLFSVAPTVSSTGTLSYTVAPNAHGVANLTIFLQDDGGTANGGDDTSPTQTFTITVNSVNDTPSFTKGNDDTVLEDSGPRTVADWATNVSAGPADEAGQTLTFNVTNDNNGLFSVQPAIAPNGTLTYTPAANQYGTANVSVTLSDNGTPAATSAAQTFTITITPVNDEPTFTKGADQTVNEDAPAQSVNGWATAINAGPNESGQAVDFVVTNNNNALFAVQPAIAADGKLTYTVAADANGMATVTVSIHDDGGTANGGVDTGAEQTFTITVNSVNDAPTFVKGADQTVLEDSGPKTVGGWATAIDVGPADEETQLPTFNVSNNNNALFSVQPAIASDGTLTFTPAPDAYGSATVTVSLSDNGGTANGGDDTSDSQTFTITVTPVNDEPSFTKGADQTVNEDAGAQSVGSWATGISAGPNESSQTVSFTVTNDNNALFSAQPSVAPNGTLTYTPAANAFGTATVTLHISDNGGTDNGGDDTSDTQTFTITVNSVNDAPSFTKGADQTKLEDSGLHTVAGWATAISAGPANESSQTLAFTVTNDNNALFSVQPAIAPNGELTYTLAANRYGSANVTVTLKDDGGTMNGGVDTSDPQMFAINVTEVNDAPSFTKGADQTVDEDSGPHTVSGWATAVSAGPFETQTLTFQVTSDNPSLFSAGPAINAAGDLTYTLVANANGVANVTVVLKDDGGTLNGGIDASAPESFKITVNSVNDAPSFVKGADQTVLEDAAAQTVTDWATSISAGPANESSQTLTFGVTNNNNALFSAQPAIAANGTLTFTPAPNQYGSATVTVTLSDDGGTANGGDDTSDPQTFTITVTPVNDAPSFTKGGDQTVNEDAGAQTVTPWATGISAGPNEASQAVSFTVTNDNNALFSVPPAVSPTGELTYTPAADAHGSATVTLYIKDNGGTDNGGVDTSPTQTFTITVNSVNDAPSFTKGADQTKLEDSGLHTVAGWATAISAGPANESSQTLAFTVTNDNNALFSVQPAIAPNGTLTYTLAADRFGTANVTVTLKDDGGTANGGDDTSDAQTFVINVTEVNDAPSFTKGDDQTVNEDSGPHAVSGWATGISAGPFETQVLTFQVTSDNPSLFSAGPAINAAGDLTYELTPDANGVANVTVTLKDDGGVANGGIDTSAPQAFKITVNAVNDAPTFVKGADQTVLEDAPAQSVTGWATAITAGPTNESSQTLAFTTSNTNPSLFSIAPAIDAATGTLTYTLAPNANGSATVTAVLKDNGGTANGGIDQTQQTFEITVTSVNDTPSFVKGADQTVLEDAGAKTVAGWATAISAGPADEAGQTLTFNVSNDNAALFSVQPAIAANGTLTYTPAPNANGSATMTVTLSDDGGNANGGDDTSDAQTFTITVTAVNDAPTYDLIPSTTSAEDAGAQTVANAVTAMSVGPANEQPPVQQLVSLTTTNNNNALFAVQPSISLTTGELTYTAAPNANGTATVTVKLKDNGGTANGGIDETTKTFMITITKENDAPVINAFAGPIAPNAVTTSITVSGNFTDVDLGDIPTTELHTVTIAWGDATSNTVIPTGTGTTRNVSANHTYATAGVYTVTLTVKDAGDLTAVATYKYVVVYDPNAGFVTGGGWINSPTGAYTANPSLTGKATFGFVSKYKKGQSQPDGNTEFQFHAAGMNFKSSVYEWLVIAGAKAQFKGTGTIDGAGNYGFMLTAIDGQLNGGGGTDKFRIKIWDKNNGDTVVYDNQILAADDANPTTVIGSGSINIQAK